MVMMVMIIIIMMVVVVMHDDGGGGGDEYGVDDNNKATRTSPSLRFTIVRIKILLCIHLPYNFLFLHSSLCF